MYFPPAHCNAAAAASAVAAAATVGPSLSCKGIDFGSFMHKEA